jgi:sulfite oxidase
MSTTNFGKHPEFVVRQASPFNAGPPLGLLIRSSETPTDLFFVRNHGEVPVIDAAAYCLEITGDVPRPLSLSLTDIQSKFPRLTIPATLQCAGNRRQELMAVQPIPGELGWGVEAISHALWTGVRLRDVLGATGVESEAYSNLHVEFIGLDETERLGKRFRFGGSIPLEKALNPEVVLAYEMNGEPLAPIHGFPLRLVVPGYIGARSVKWLSRITIQSEPSQNYFQRHAYRLFPTHVRPDSVNWDDGLMLGEMNITSVICSPQENTRLPAGKVTVEGYSIAGGGRQVARVEVSADGGQTWVQAELSQDPQPWAWRLWRVNLDLKLGQYQLAVRAVDTAANAQPPDILQVWNFKGYMNNAWHRVRIEVVP